MGQIVIFLATSLAYIIYAIARLCTRRPHFGGARSNPVISEKTTEALTYLDRAVREPRPTLFFEGLSYAYPYGKYDIFKHNCHIGQRKLLLNEIQFFTYYGAGAELIIYVGAAPCEHLPVIQRLFPGHKFLLIDPNFCIMDTEFVYIYQNPEVISNDALRIIEVYRHGRPHQRAGVTNLENAQMVNFGSGPNHQFNALDFRNNRPMLDEQKEAFNKWGPIYDFMRQSDHNVFVIQDYMSIDLATQLGATPDMLLVSDLRTNLWLRTGPIDLDILFNDCLQISILDILRPEYSMLKFHPPYFNSEHSIDSHPAKKIIQEPIDYAGKLMGRDLYAEHRAKHHYNYEAERILLQPWAPTASSEARLIVSRSTIEKQRFAAYDAEDWDNKFFVLKYIRMYSWYPAFEGISGYDGCYDCYIELSIISQYLVRDKVADLPNHIPQEPDTEGITRVSAQINEHMRYDLEARRNKHCRLHGANRRHKRYIFFVRVGREWRSWENGKIGPPEYALNECFGPAEKKIMRELLRA